MGELATGSIGGCFPSSLLETPGQGKMFGVLVVRAPDGSVGFCKAFSGTLEGRWEVDGFVPPMFDRASRMTIEPQGDAVVKGLLALADSLTPEVENVRKTFEARAREWAGKRVALVAHQKASRLSRRAERARIAASSLAERHKNAQLFELDQESRRDKAALRRLEQETKLALQGVGAHTVRIERRYRALIRLRRSVSRRLMREIQDTYQVPATSGQCRLRELFTDGEPPAGAGDCAAPKLLAFAHRSGLQPIALAEFWWGSPSLTSGRRAGVFYPPCRGKCGPILEFMLRDIAPAYRPWEPQGAHLEPLKVVFEDDWILIVDKPAGLPSVPGRRATADSVGTRLGARHLGLSRPTLVHRLDMDTSGLMVVAKDPASHALLQRQFTRREVSKRYVAWLDGCVSPDAGCVNLPIRVDLDDRPRQIHDPILGKPAITHWRVLDRVGRRTRLAFFPETGRTHQIRVHASHPLGLGVPIVGDRLYGQADRRMLLHAEGLEFRHPRTDCVLSFCSLAPF